MNLFTATQLTVRLVVATGRRVDKCGQLLPILCYDGLCFYVLN